MILGLRCGANHGKITELHNNLSEKSNYIVKFAVILRLRIRFIFTMKIKYSSFIVFLQQKDYKQIYLSILIIFVKLFGFEYL